MASELGSKKWDCKNYCNNRVYSQVSTISKFQIFFRFLRLAEGELVENILNIFSCFVLVGNLSRALCSRIVGIQTIVRRHLALCKLFQVRIVNTNSWLNVQQFNIGKSCFCLVYAPPPQDYAPFVTMVVGLRCSFYPLFKFIPSCGVTLLILWEGCTA